MEGEGKPVLASSRRGKQGKKKRNLLIKKEFRRKKGLTFPPSTPRQVLPQKKNFLSFSSGRGL